MARILILEDDDLIARSLVSLLSRAGHTALDVSTGREAEQIIPSLQADVVISDIAMGGGDGLESIARLRRLRPAVKVVAVAFEPVDETRIQAATACGATRILNSSANASQLLDTVTELLETD